jgi:transposase-like protein
VIEAVPNIDLGFHRHETRCPHCQQQTEYSWPGETTLFASLKCSHCGKEFVIVLDEPRQ